MGIHPHRSLEVLPQQRSISGGLSVEVQEPREDAAKTSAQTCVKQKHKLLRRTLYRKAEIWENISTLFFFFLPWCRNNKFLQRLWSANQMKSKHGTNGPNWPPPISQTGFTFFPCSPTVLDLLESLEHALVFHCFVYFYRPFPFWKALVHPSHSSNRKQQQTSHLPCPPYPHPPAGLLGLWDKIRHFLLCTLTQTDFKSVPMGFWLST